MQLKAQSQCDLLPMALLSFKEETCSPSKEGKVGNVLNIFYGLSEYCSRQNHLWDGGTVFALRSFLGSRDGQHEVVCSPKPWVRAEEGDGG